MGRRGLGRRKGTNNCGHNDRPHFAKEKCRTCYTADYRSKNGRHDNQATPAAKARKKKWANNNRELSRREVKAYHIRKTFGLSIEEYESKLKAQNNLCALCGNPFQGSGRESLAPVLDHDHITGQPREFLHRKCNVAIGQLLDSPELCQKAKEYLEKHKELSMYVSKDGKKFGSAYVGRKHDEYSEPKDEKDAKKKMGNVLEDKAGEMAEEAGSKDMAGEGNKDVSNHPVVKDHGKAHTVTIKHDHSANKHHVTSMHDDGHTNMSEHGSVDEAHQEGQALAGGQPPSMSSEEQDHDMHGGGTEDDGFEMPGL